jgi:uncharacterized protein YjbJ (UPF0337 family)
MGDKKDRTTGKIKEKAGTVTGDRGLRQKGRDEQAKGDIKKSAAKAKDARCDSHGVLRAPCRRCRSAA